MNPATFDGARKLLESTKKALEHTQGITVIVAPPAVYLRELRAAYRGSKMAFAAQNAHFEAGGAHTGEMSMRMVSDAHATHVIIGHAERRAAGETNEDTQKKAEAALAEGLIPILCVGESARDPGGQHFEFIRQQLHVGLQNVSPAKLARVIIAYEPIWAIGATAAMNPRDMHEMAIFIRKSLVDLHGSAGQKLKILYGGSIEESNAPDMLLGGDVDGLLVGRASTETDRVERLLSAIGSTKA